MRNADKDLELCNRATPGPWYIQDEISHGTVRVWSKERVYRKIDNVDYQTWHIAASGYIDGKHGKIQLDNAKFIAESREALPYWIKRAVEAEKLLLNFAYIDLDESIRERCDNALEVQTLLKEQGYEFKEVIGGGEE